MVDHFSLACLLLNKFARSKLFGATCNLLVSCETTKEVVQTCFDPVRFNERAGSTNVEPLVSQIVVDKWFKGFLGQHMG